MLRLEVVFLPPATTPDVAVVVDVLRMTTTATVLLELGLEELAVVAASEEARAVAERSEALLIGERQGMPLPGFDHGNSPLEFTRAEVQGKRAVICTTNGSRAVEAAANARHLLLGALINDDAVAERALALATDEITFVCSGTDGRVSLEDIVGAGCIIQRLLERTGSAELSDAARTALLLAESAEGPAALVRQATHAATLSALGFDADIEFATRRGSSSVVGERRWREPARFS